MTVFWCQHYAGGTETPLPTHSGRVSLERNRGAGKQALVHWQTRRYLNRGSKHEAKHSIHHRQCIVFAILRVYSDLLSGNCC
jgi:hypothetical protein